MNYNISPIDGRYKEQTEILGQYFSEFALFKYRLKVELLYFIELFKSGVITDPLTSEQEKQLYTLYQLFNEQDYLEIKEIEKTTRHDIKALEYFIKSKIKPIGLNSFVEHVHFGLTSQDINNTAIPLSLQDANNQLIVPEVISLCELIHTKGLEWKPVAMLARTHGQAASPTSMGKEFLVFSERLEKLSNQLKEFAFEAKFGGATGSFNAHCVSYPHIEWRSWADRFVSQRLHLKRQHYTTQIAHYDDIAEYYQMIIRLNTILIDLCRDVWTYISFDYFKQEVITGEVGSSAMPHKVNPIDFENAEGNLGLSTSIAQHFVEKLPISRLQRDLTDSTVLRNTGVPLAHSWIAFQSLRRGLNKIKINKEKINSDLNSQYIILAEAVQCILRKEKVENAYELLKQFTRGKNSITKEEYLEFIRQLPVSQNIIQQFEELSPENYTGYSCQ